MLMYKKVQYSSIRRENFQNTIVALVGVSFIPVKIRLYASCVLLLVLGVHEVVGVPIFVYSISLPSFSLSLSLCTYTISLYLFNLYLYLYYLSLYLYYLSDQ
uniref:Uncharacterized protein n=1 Tax=Cacopsylla melanoneura TaxID=428564 RepID=A0A8D8QUU1_9HEMI